MPRIGSMNMLLHGVKNPDIRYKDSLAEGDEDDSEKYSHILANHPFTTNRPYLSLTGTVGQLAHNFHSGPPSLTSSATPCASD